MSIGVPTNIKNMYIGGNQPGEVYVENPEGHTTISGAGYVTASGMNLRTTELASATISNMTNGSGNTVTLTLSNNSGKKLFGMPSISFYETSQATANSIPDGSNIGASDYAVAHWVDWGESDGNNIVVKSWIRNDSGVTVDVLYRATIRYIIDNTVLS